MDAVTKKLQDVVKERDKVVATLEADLESEKDSRREKQEVARVLREKVSLMVRSIALCWYLSGLSDIPIGTRTFCSCIN